MLALLRLVLVFLAPRIVMFVVFQPFRFTSNECTPSTVHFGAGICRCKAEQREKDENDNRESHLVSTVSSIARQSARHRSHDYLNDPGAMVGILSCYLIKNIP